MSPGAIIAAGAWILLVAGVLRANHRLNVAARRARIREYEQQQRPRLAERFTVITASGTTCWTFTTKGGRTVGAVGRMTGGAISDDHTV